MSYQAVLPMFDYDRTHRCLNTIGEMPERSLTLVDNREDNRGVAAAWNRGRHAAMGLERDWLILVSEAVTFGPGGIAAFADRLDEHPTAVGVGAYDLGWKLVALRVSMLEVVGEFDVVFYPAYWEDTDYLYRMGLADFDSPRENGRAWSYVHGTRARHSGNGTAIRQGWIPSETLSINEGRYVAKWGGGQGDEQWQHPYNDPTLDLTFTGRYPCTTQ